jgi:hypothetical protein
MAEDERDIERDANREALARRQTVRGPRGKSRRGEGPRTDVKADGDADGRDRPPSHAGRDRRGPWLGGG